MHKIFILKFYYCQYITFTSFLYPNSDAHKIYNKLTQNKSKKNIAKK